MFFETLLDLLFPPTCPACGQRIEKAGALCASCFSALRFFAGNTPKEAAALVYDDASKGLVLSLKYGDRIELAGLMGQMMVRAGSGILKGADLIVSVPLHRRRLFVRKYNQAALLGQEVSRISLIAHNPFVLKRVRMTEKQSSRQKRFENVRKAFEFDPRFDVRGRTVVLVDDVITTGATAFACAAALRGAGAKEVRFLMFAKAVRD